MATDTRRRLIRTTYRLLQRQGYGATGLNQIIAEADAPKGSMYFHFPGGKEELAKAAVDYFGERVADRMDEILASSESVADGVAQMFDNHISLFERTDFSEGCAVASVALDAAADHPPLAEATGRAVQRWTDLVADRLEAEGHSPEEARRLAALVIATLEGVLVVGKAQRSNEPVAAVRDALKTILTPPVTTGASRRRSRDAGP